MRRKLTRALKNLNRIFGAFDTKTSYIRAILSVTEDEADITSEMMELRFGTLASDLVDRYGDL